MVALAFAFGVQHGCRGIAGRRRSVRRLCLSYWRTRDVHNPDARLARCLGALFNPTLYPGVGEILRITQQELAYLAYLAYLVGLSRQRVNEALTALQAQGVIRVEYGGVRVLDLTALRSTVFKGKNEFYSIKYKW